MIKVYLTLLLLLLLRILFAFIAEDGVKNSDGANKEFLEIRTVIENVYKRALPYKQAEILSGIILGSRQLDKKLKQDMINAGLIHLVVASGMNLTLLGGFCLAIFTGLHFSRRYIFIFSSLAVIVYSMITGFDPPIVRALIMFEAVALGGMVGRKGGGFFALLLAAYIMLWVNPWLVSSFSFLLSFASMIGQILAGTFVILLPALLKAIVLVILQNLMAILFTAPIIMYGFGRFSFISIVSNLLVVCLIEPLMVVGSVAGIVGLTGNLGITRFFLAPLSFLLEYFLWVASFFGAEGKFTYQVESMNLLLVAGYYVIVFVIFYSRFKRSFG